MRQKLVHLGFLVKSTIVSFGALRVNQIHFSECTSPELKSGFANS